MVQWTQFTQANGKNQKHQTTWEEIHCTTDEVNWLSIPKPQMNYSSLISSKQAYYARKVALQATPSWIQI